MRVHILKRITLLFLVIIVLISVGCSKLNKENYEKLKMGMAYSEVISILGKADKCDSTIGVKSCTWDSEAKQIKVKFIAEKVVFFSEEGL